MTGNGFNEMMTAVSRNAIPIYFVYRKPHPMTNDFHVIIGCEEEKNHDALEETCFIIRACHHGAGLRDSGHPNAGAGRRRGNFQRGADPKRERHLYPYA